MADLFAGCSDDEDIDKGLRTNNAYAKKYDEWRRKEELMKAKARFGSDLEASSDEDSTDAETEDEDAKYIYIYKHIHIFFQHISFTSVKRTISWIRKIYIY